MLVCASVRVRVVGLGLGFKGIRFRVRILGLGFRGLGLWF